MPTPIWWPVGCGVPYGPFDAGGNQGRRPIRFDGPPRVIALGFQIANGKLIGPRIFLPILLTTARKRPTNWQIICEAWDPSSRNCLPLEDMEYTTMPQVMEKLKGRFEPIEEEARRKQRG